MKRKENLEYTKYTKKETDIWLEGFVKQIDINENVEYNKKITVVRIV